MLTENNDSQRNKTKVLLEDLVSLESYIHDLFFFAPIPIAFITPRGVILEANPAFEKIANASSSEILGLTIAEFLKEKEAERIQKESLANGSVEGTEVLFFPKNKERIFVQANTRAREDEDGTAVGYFLSVFDLTKIKESEEEIKQSQKAILNILEDTEESRKTAEEEKNKTKAIINNFSDGLLVFGPDGRLFSINPQAEIFFEVKEKEVIGLSFQEIKRYPYFNKLISVLEKQPDEIFRQELELKKNLVLELSTVFVKTDGKVAGILAVIHDITREKLVERMKTEFVSIAAHQLRTPLSAIKWTLRILLDGDLGAISDEQRGFIEKCYRSNERMIGLINDLLDVTRIEEGRYVYEKLPTRIEPLVESVIGIYQEEAAKKGIDLLFRPPKRKTPLVMADPEKIKMVIQNLVENAIKYTKNNGKIEVSLIEEKEKIVFSVKDSGVGIPEDQKNRVFSKFFRAANVMRMETEGSGLGLFIAKNIIRAHNGEIWFDSKEKKGSIFSFSLPLVDEAGGCQKPKKTIE